ncbi:MAG: hypothetical protein GX654_13150 [Desulfatiglans sp.]|nr:hypothetical protein [Desulfatiglans sp.]
MTFKELFSLTFKYVYAFRLQLSKALLVPFILSILLDIIPFFWSSFLISIINMGLSLMIQTIFAVTTHRMILLGPSHVPTWGIMKWSIRETVFIFHVVALALIIFLCTLIMHIPIIGTLIFFVLVFLYLVLLLPRLSLVFPAIAVGDRCSFKNSWFVTKNYHKLMFFSIILIPLIVSIPAILIRNIPYTFLIVSILTNVTTVVGVASLSLSYKYILKEFSA